MDIPNGETAGDTAIGASANASGTTAQNETNVWEAIANRVADDDSTAQRDADELEKTLEEDATDDKIPDDDTEGDDPDKPADEKKPRSKNFKELQEANSSLEATLLERDTEFNNVKEKLSTLDEALESYGGVEQVGTLIENQNKFIDPARYKEAVDYLATLPQAPAVYGEILNRSFNIGDVALDAAAEAKANANRVAVVNGALAKDFGLAANLSEAEMTQAFQWLAARANKDKSELLTDITDELELLAPDAGSAADKATQARIDALEKQLEEQKNANTQGEKTTEEALDPVKITSILNEYEADVINTVSADVLKDYNTTLDALSPLKANAIKALVRQELGAGQIFIQLADYLITDKEHPNGKFLATQYKNAVKTLVRSTAIEFLGKPPAVAAAPPTSKTTSTGITGTGKGSIAPTTKTDAKNVWGEILNRD